MYGRRRVQMFLCDSIRILIYFLYQIIYKNIFGNIIILRGRVSICVSYMWFCFSLRDTFVWRQQSLPIAAFQQYLDCNKFARNENLKQLQHQPRASKTLSVLANNNSSSPVQQVVQPSCKYGPRQVLICRVGPVSKFFSALDKSFPFFLFLLIKRTCFFSLFFRKIRRIPWR